MSEEAASSGELRLQHSEVAKCRRATAATHHAGALGDENKVGEGVGRNGLRRWRRRDGRTQVSFAHKPRGVGLKASIRLVMSVHHSCVTGPLARCLLRGRCGCRAPPILAPATG